jgi:hypothetical protein
MRKVPEGKVMEGELDSALTPSKRRAGSPGAGDHVDKKQKGNSAEPSGAEAKQNLEGSESLASKEAKTAETTMKAAKTAKAEAARAKQTKAADVAATKDTKAMKAKAAESAKALIISKAPR